MKLRITSLSYSNSDELSLVVEIGADNDEECSDLPISLRLAYTGKCGARTVLSAVMCLFVLRMRSMRA